jgi:hypothetical protein
VVRNVKNGLIGIIFNSVIQCSGMETGGIFENFHFEQNLSNLKLG